MRKIQRRKSDFMVKRQLGSAAYPQFKGIGAFPNKQKCAGYIPEHCLPICKKRKERIKFMRDLGKLFTQKELILGFTRKILKMNIFR